MTAIAYSAAEVTSADRLGMALILAIIVHAMVIFGVSFVPEPVPESRYESMEVILVAQKSDEAPDDASLLAQANLKGGGDDDSSERPTAPMPTTLPAPTPEVAAMPPPPVPAETTAEPEPDSTATDSGASQNAEAPQPAEIREEMVQEVATAPDPLPLPESKPAPAEPVTTAEPSQTAQTEVQSPPLPTAAQLITRSFALASLNAELEQKLDLRAKRPRRKFVSANTREYRFASYMEAWRAKVERVGNINYPDEARRRNLSGSLLLDVAINPDGSVGEITVRRSSGHPVLDDAAVRIVELAAPFAPFPDDFRRDIDILHVTRTWKFLQSQEFTGQ